jgi:anti-anti-sigma factor
MDTTALERLQAENEALRSRIEALEVEKARREIAEAERARRLGEVGRVLRELPLIVDIFDVATKRSVFKNRELDSLLGYPPGALAAMGPQPMLYKTVHPDDIPGVVALVERISEGKVMLEEVIVEYRVRRGDGAPGWFRSQLRTFDREGDGRLSSHLMVTYDITEAKVAEAALRALNAELDGLVAERTASLEDANQKLRIEIALRTRLAAEAEARARLIRELSSPVLRVWDDVVTIPIIGALDTERAEIIHEALLGAISQTGVRFSILDLTGVSEMDAATAEHIRRIVDAASLLGAEVVICGIRSPVARIMVAGGLALNASTVKNLREALRLCIRRRRA